MFVTVSRVNYWNFMQIFSRDFFGKIIFFFFNYIVGAGRRLRMYEQSCGQPLVLNKSILFSHSFNYLYFWLTWSLHLISIKPKPIIANIYSMFLLQHIYDVCAMIAMNNTTSRYSLNFNYLVVKTRKVGSSNYGRVFSCWIWSESVCYLYLCQILPVIT